MSVYALAILGLLLGLFAGILVCFEIGYRLGRKDSNRIQALAYVGIGAIDATLFALLGLLLAFSFSGATSRLDARRQLIVREASAIGTAYLRVDLLPSNEQPKLRSLFTDYLNARVRAYETFAQRENADEQFARATALQREIWSQALTASQADQTQNSTRLLLPAINEMIDVSTSRTIALENHLPALVFGLLICIALLCAVLAGYVLSQRQTRSWLHILLYAMIVSGTIGVIFDFDNPRYGLIKVDAADKALVQLRDSIR